MPKLRSPRPWGFFAPADVGYVAFEGLPRRNAGKCHEQENDAGGHIRPHESQSAAGDAAGDDRPEKKKP